MIEIEQQPLLETGASEISTSTEQDNSNRSERKDPILSVEDVEDLTKGIDGQINSQKVKEQAPPSLPKPAPADEINLALLELARANLPNIELDLALIQMQKTTKIGLKTLKGVRPVDHVVENGSWRWFD